MSQYQGDDEALTMPCDHIFHKNCLITWLKNVSRSTLLKIMYVGR